MELSDILKLLEQLVAVRSTADNPEALDQVIRLTEEYLTIPGLKTERFTSNGKVNLLVSRADKTDRAFDVLLNGHLDVVPANDEQFTMVVRDGKVLGRGVYDMKGGAAVLMKLYKDLVQSGHLGNVGLMLVTDEEIGGHNGVKLLLEQEKIAGKFFLVAEPTDFAICHQQKGIIWLELTEHGKPAHGSRPWEGQNANVSLAQKIAAFYATVPQPTATDDWKTSYTLSIMRGGGEAKNIVADKAVAYMDVRRIESEDAASVIAKVQDFFRGTDVKVLLDEPCLNAPTSDTYVQQLAAAIKQATGHEAQFTRETFGSDARFYSAIGVPAVNFGPVGGDMHGDNEWLDVMSLDTYYQIMEAFLTHQARGNT